MATKTRKITQDTWNIHKEAILSLYLISDLSLNELVQAMGSDHGFSATVSQFEAQLKVWKARKNLKRSEWEEHLETIDRLSSRGVRSRVVISGHPVSMNRVHRARRYCNGEFRPNKHRRVESDLHGATNSCSTNDALIEIQDQNGEWARYTPTADRGAFNGDPQPSSSSASGFDMQWQPVEDNINQAGLAHGDTASSPRLSNMSPRLLPSDISFDNLLSTCINQNFPGSLDLSFVGPASSISQLSSQHERDPDIAITFPSLEVASFPLGSINATQFQFGKFSTEDLPFERFEYELMSRGLKLTTCSSPLQDSRLLFGTQKLVSIFLHEAAASMSYDNENSYQENFYRAGLVLQRLDTILPRTQQGCENSSMVLCTQEKSDIDLHRLLLLSAANGFVGMGDIPIKTVFRFLDHSSNVTSLLSRLFRETKSPVMRSLAENLFRAAIEACDHQKTKFFLQTGLVDVNSTFCFVEGEKRTPLERASELQGLKVIRELLSFNPKPNQASSTPVKNSVCKTGKALELLIEARLPGHKIERDHSIFSSEYLEAVDALIEAGAEIRGPSIRLALKKSVRMDLAEILLRRLAPSLHSEAMFEDILKLTAEEFTDEIAKELIAKILLNCEQTGCKTCLSCFPDEIDAAIVSGAKRGHVQLVQFLFLYAKSSTRVLSAAIRGGNQALVDFVLAQNPDIHRSPPERLYESSAYTTPLAEAIDIKDDALITILESRGALEHLCAIASQKSRFTPAMAAAARVGNINYMKKLLLLHHNAKDDELEDALYGAIENQQVDSVQLLLALGSVKLSFDPRNIQFTAYRWGNKSVLIDLMSNMEGHVLGYKMLFPFLDNPEPGDADMFNFFAHSDMATKSFLTNCLQIAIKHNDGAMLRYLLERGADATDWEALRTAAKERPEMLRILLASYLPTKNIFPGSGQGAIKEAIEQSNIEMLEMLINSKAVDFKFPLYGIAPLARAIAKDTTGSGSDFPLTTRILGTGCDINGIVGTKSSEYITPLVAAIETKNKDLVQFLIDNGANINKEAFQMVRRTPLQAAAQVGSLEIVELLLRKGANVNAKPALRSGGTALQFAARSGNCNIAMVLMGHGANLYESPSEFGGRWPIEAAAEEGRLDMIQFLWNVSIIGFPIEQCRKAIHLAEEGGHIGCKELILMLAVSSGIIPALEG
ncbi:ankyrin [Annulohypoxylon bovei var. microspora]|nr:ankyrin [Annulohypoxylon bovei var. microspora]